MKRFNAVQAQGKDNCVDISTLVVFGGGAI